ncbi:hypothetical protein [Pedobacter deserti]|uniref:hypothetical protein n=1 Tax=Pedobacter deserti TaxID=2817382 RepID=UPI00210E239D|nr:hypothetical protein [Pedobacter sp. SYSU D00382]
MKSFCFVIFTLFGLAFSNIANAQQSAPWSDEKFDSAWTFQVDKAGLKFKIPNGYKKLSMKEANYGKWHCIDQYEAGFMEVLINEDRTVVIGLGISQNSHWTSPDGKPMSTKVNWKQNAKVVFSNRNNADKPNRDIHTDTLAKYWNAIYGKIFTRKACKQPFIKDFVYHRHVLIADESKQILMVYFYKDPQLNIDKVIESTYHMLAVANQK